MRGNLMEKKLKKVKGKLLCFTQVKSVITQDIIVQNAMGLKWGS
jgi:hypothetical protein